MTGEAWGMLVSAHVTAGDLKGAVAVLRRAQNDSFHSSLVAPVLAKFIGHGDVNSLLELMSELQQLFPGVVNDYAYTQLVQSLGEHEHPAAGVKLFLHMETHNINIVPDTYVAMMKGFALAGQHTMCLSVFKDMQKTGHAPTSMAFSHLVTAAAKAGKLELVHDVFRMLNQTRVLSHYTEDRLRPYTVYLELLAQAEKHDELKLFWNSVFRRTRVHPKDRFQLSKAYNLVLNYTFKTRRSVRERQAEEEEAGTVSGVGQRQQLANEAEQLLQELERKVSFMQPHSYAIMMKFWVTVDVSKTHYWFCKVAPPDMPAYYLMFGACFNFGDCEMATSVWKDMCKRNITPSVLVTLSYLRIFRKYRPESFGALRAEVSAQGLQLPTDQQVEEATKSQSLTSSFLSTSPLPGR